MAKKNFLELRNAVKLKNGKKQKKDQHTNEGIKTTKGNTVFQILDNWLQTLQKVQDAKVCRGMG